MIPLNTLMEESKCYTCLGISLAEALRLALLNRIGSLEQFSPADIAGLYFWIKADAEVFSDAGTTPAVNNDPVQQWNDQSGGGNNPNQAVLANRPNYVTNSQNGLPTVDYSMVFADNRWLDCPLADFWDAGAGGVFTFFAVVQAGPNSGDTHLLIENTAGGAVLIQNPSYVFQKNGGAFDTLTSFGDATGIWVVLMVTRSGSGAGDTKIYINGIQNDNGIAIPGLVAPGSCIIGFPALGTWTGKIAEMGIYNSVLSDANRGLLLAGMQTKWGV
jgi:hypothetical protein